MKHLVIIFTILFLLGCSHDRITVSFPEDKTICDEFGVPSDSSSYYFPERLFNDTTADHEYSRIWQLKILSYLLYKMKEPILDNIYLNKEIYRLTIDASFSKPMVIRIEKNSDSIVIYTKILNRGITYPFRVYDTTDLESDLLNNTNYSLFLNKQKKLHKTEWNNLSSLIDSTKFWRTLPDVALYSIQIDGSRWIFEGHNQFGYQIRLIPNPNFDRKDIYENKFDKKNNYRNLFEYLAKISDLKLH